MPVNFPRLLRAAALAALMLPAAASAVRANDFSIAVAAGGLQIAEQSGLVLRHHELTLGPDRVHARYVVENTTQAEVSALVAFAQPEIPAPSHEGPLLLADETTLNPLAAEIRVDGATVTPEQSVRAVAMGIDRSAMLRELGLPLAPYLEEARAGIETLGAEQLAGLSALGLLREGMDGPEPGWKMQATPHWLQRFPAGGTITIDLTYRPLVWRNLAAPLWMSPESDAEIAAAGRTYCLSDKMAGAVRAARPFAWQQGFNGAALTYRIDPVANWAGPPDGFRLMIEAASPADHAFACLDGARRISPSRLVLADPLAWPAGQIEVLFVEPAARGN